MSSELHDPERPPAWVTTLRVAILAFIPCISLVIDFLSDKFDMIDYIPAVIGVPAAAIGAYFLVSRFARGFHHPPQQDASMQADPNSRTEPVPVNTPTPADNSTTPRNTTEGLVFLWLVCFLALVFLLRMMWPTDHTRKDGRIKTGTAQQRGNAEDIVEVTLLQINDVYEISPLDSGRSGGLARVATLRQQLLESNPNVYTLLAGDFLFPSAMGTLPYNGQREMKGVHMVKVLNKVPVDLVTFGNHEFDIDKADQLHERIDLSAFEWISANVSQPGNRPFTRKQSGSRTAIPPTKQLEFTNQYGGKVRIGIVGVTIGTTEKDYVMYTSDSLAIAQAVSELSKTCDVIVALTHLERQRDVQLAKHFPEISLFIGGHEHVNSIDPIQHPSGRISYVAKADANARTAYVHTLRYNTRTREVEVSSDLRTIDESLKEDELVKAEADYWNHWADSSWKAQGYSPCKVLTDLEQPLDGTEASVRFKPTNLTGIITKAMFEACQGTVDASLLNSGSLRLDDSIRVKLTVYDIIRTIPYGGKIWIVEMRGSLLKQLLDTSKAHPGNGCFLQYFNIEPWGSTWKINGRMWQPDDTYRVAIGDYLAKGRQENMRFFSPSNKDVIRVDSLTPPASLRGNLVNAVTDFIVRYYPKPAAGSRAGAEVPCY
jgi:2',3'-cyclic-nucleotide 2'-phosphodiesterase (5'-nucleotidase family)